MLSMVQNEVEEADEKSNSSEEGSLHPLIYTTLRSPPVSTSAKNEEYPVFHNQEPENHELRHSGVYEDQQPSPFADTPIPKKQTRKTSPISVIRASNQMEVLHDFHLQVTRTVHCNLLSILTCPSLTCLKIYYPEKYIGFSVRMTEK